MKRNSVLFSLTLILVLFLALVGPAPADAAGSDDLDDAFLDALDQEAEKGIITIPDPLAPWNRAMFQLNDRLYFWIAKPVAQGYRAVVPTPLRVGFRNFFTNLLAPVRIVNCLLQGKGHAAADEFTRFVLNSGPGLFGFLDATQNIPALQHADEDLGQTLAVYGFKDGFYLVWPILGPSTLRDSIGFVGDHFLSPTTYVEPLAASMGIKAFREVNNLSFHIGDYESFKEIAFDPYDALRNAYLQNRRQHIAE